MRSLFPDWIFQSLARTQMSAYIQHSLWAFAILETFHIMGLAILLGSIFLINLTVLGVGLKKSPPALARELAPWMVFGLALTLGSGIPMFMSSAIGYSLSDAMSIKLGLLTLAIVLQFVIHLVPGLEDGNVYGKTAAVVSMLCWFGVAWAGRAIAFPNLLGG